MDEGHELDCKTIYQQAISIFCHDFGAVVGNMGGYSDIISRKTDEDPSFDDFDILELLEFIPNPESKGQFISLAEHLKANLADCNSELRPLLKRIYHIYENHYLVWHEALQKLINIYNQTGILDKDLSKQLVYHARELVNFRNELLQERSTW